jgi:Asp/Glu/hydantoin racemase
VTICVINPNSSTHVTEGIDRAVAPMRAASPVPIEARTLAEGPPGIETQAHIDGVISPLLDHCAALEDSASAFVIACFSDPGLTQLRQQARAPALGIAESSILTAMTLGEKFGIVSILSESIPRHARYVEAMGGTSRMAADLPLELGVLELQDEDRTMRRLTEVATELRDTKGADVLILGCAGMAGYRQRLETIIGLPVVEPCQAAVAMAIGRIALELTGKDNS